MRRRIRKKKIFSYAGYPPEFSEEFRKDIRKRDNYRCAICDTKERMDVHHIDYDKMNTTKHNCISLCRDCHKAIHKMSWTDKHAWKIRLWRIAGMREMERVNGQQRTR